MYLRLQCEYKCAREHFVILAGKRESRRHFTRRFCKKGVVAKTGSRNVGDLVFLKSRKGLAIWRTKSKVNIHRGRTELPRLMNESSFSQKRTSMNLVFGSCIDFTVYSDVAEPLNDTFRLQALWRERSPRKLSHINLYAKTV